MENNNTVSHIKNNTIEMLKFALFDNNQILEMQQTLNEFKNNNHTKSKTNIQNSNILYKKINMAFKAMSNLIKLLLLQVDEKKYQDFLDQTITFPKNIEILEIVLGSFDKAFTPELHYLLFQIFDFHAYDELYSISKINSFLIPLLSDEKSDDKELKKDFDDFIILIKEFACVVLDVNTNLDPHNMIEIVSI